MKKIIPVSFLFCWFSLKADAQQLSEPYPFSHDIRSEIEHDTVSWKYQTGAARYSFIGDYKNTLRTWDLAIPARTYVPTSADSLILREARIRNARDYIVKRSKQEQLIIINEAHHNPLHRVFTKSLLKGLYKNGYRYLGLEALSDPFINERGYAVKTSGFYLNEPQFANLVYEALQAGFTVFGYEASEGKNGKEREIEQARNIEAFMKSHPQGKYLIHCGFDHVYEKEVRNWEKAMAGRLYEYTHIDPFTIDQVKFSEKSQPGYAPYFIRATNEKEPFVLTGHDGFVFNGLKEPKQTDISVIHPFTTYTDKRPGWLAQNKKAYRTETGKISHSQYPIQIMAYRSGELEQQGIPSDIIELHSPDDAGFLYLQEGTYKIIIRNTGYTIIDAYDVLIGK